MPGASIQNRFLSVSVDARGRIVSLRNKATGTELVQHPGAAEAWRLVIATGRHTREMPLGSRQRPTSIRVVTGAGSRSVVMAWDELTINGSKVPLAMTCTLELGDAADEIAARVRVDNATPWQVEEVEFPVIGGIVGLGHGAKRPVVTLVLSSHRGTFSEDVLFRGLPRTGPESDHYVRVMDTCMMGPDTMGIMADLSTTRQGLYLGYPHPFREDFVVKIEKHPKERPNEPRHAYPEGTPRWLRVWGIHLPGLAPGKSWTSQEVTLMPHVGDWHAGADRFAARLRPTWKIAQAPAFMDSFVGWTSILGKTYMGEVFHDYATCATRVVQDKKVTGLDLLFYYGHSRIGAEGADFDHSPAPDLGGEAGFREMVDTLHANGIRIMLLDHFHAYINRSAPEYAAVNPERFAARDRDGNMIWARWWKETALSCRHLAGPTPEWLTICPACAEWWVYFKQHLAQIVELGVDGVELDVFGQPSHCYSPDHGHRVGASVLEAKIEAFREMRAYARSLNRDFFIIAETMVPAVREVADGFYPFRFFDENDRIYRYLFPELTQQAVLVGTYAYDQVNKALSLGIGVETEIQGLRSTTLAACPELARHIGEVNRFKRRHPELMIRGTFRDTVGARVKGHALYSVLLAPGSGDKALVVRNPSDASVRCEARLDGIDGRRLVAWRPFAGEKTVSRLPWKVTLGPYAVAVLFTAGQ